MSDEVILDGVLLAEDQGDDPLAIPLDVVVFDEARDYPVSINFQGDPIGTARIRRGDAGLHARIVLTEPIDVSGLPFLAVGGVGTRGKFGEISAFWARDVAVTHSNANPKHPPYAVARWCSSSRRRSGRVGAP